MCTCTCGITYKATHTQVGLNSFAYMLILPVVEHVAERLTSVRRLATCSLLSFLHSQVKLVLDVESIIPQYFRHGCVAKSETFKPNTNPHHHDMIKDFAEESDLSSGTIANALNPQKVSTP